MKNACVVDDETLSRVEPETHFHRRIIDDFAEPAIGVVICRHHLEGDVGQRRGRPVVESDADQLAVRRQLDHRPPRHKPCSRPADIFEPRTMVRKNIEPELVLLTKTPRRGEPVDNRAVAALGRTFEAVKNLDCRHRIPVGIVGMGLKAKAGIGKVGRVDFGPHFELATVIRLADIAEEIDDPHQRTVLDRPAGHVGKAVLHKRSEPVSEFRFVRNDLIETHCRKRRVQPAVPATHLWRDPAATKAGFGPVIAMRHQPVGIERDGSRLACKGDFQPVAGHSHPRHGNV